ncbi:hypothetical protein BWI17_13360 [Betaproteobacteria bacterium GR16-43]|nr:hypothetical protein BWI17_13360 [Betaproteobacteria bacterium GR16-43]
MASACGAGHSPLPQRLGRHTLRLLHDNRRLTRPEAANLGLRHATAPAIAFLDDDDALLPEHFAVLSEALRQRADVAFAYGVSCVTDVHGQVLRLYGEPFVASRMLVQGHFAVGSFLMRRSLVEAGVRFDEALEVLEDLEFFAQCAQRSEMLFVPRAVHRYNIEAGTSGTGTQTAERALAVRTALAHIHGKWRK